MLALVSVSKYIEAQSNTHIQSRSVDCLVLGEAGLCLTNGTGVLKQLGQ